jgi:hypothetical protein
MKKSPHPPICMAAPRAGACLPHTLDVETAAGEPLRMAPPGLSGVAALPWAPDPRQAQSMGRWLRAFYSSTPALLPSFLARSEWAPGPMRRPPARRGRAGG